MKAKDFAMLVHSDFNPLILGVLGHTHPSVKYDFEEIRLWVVPELHCCLVHMTVLSRQKYNMISVARLYPAHLKTNSSTTT
jgi:hypothetical protein